MSRAREAIPRFEAALALTPDDAGTYNNLAVALGIEGRFEEGMRAIEAALRLSPADPGALANLERLRSGLGAAR
jgi:Flp pilus assembly protein TadD